MPARMLLALAGLLWAAAVEAGPVAVRVPEGALRGFLVLRAADGRALADGELVQNPRGERLESRLTFRFKDGSLHDEAVVFTQHQVFALVSYRPVQRGPAFPQALDVRFQRSGEYAVRVRESEQGPETAHEGRFDFPPDVANGMALALVKNLPPGARAETHYVAFTPKPRVLALTLIPVGEDRFFIGDLGRTAVRYLAKLELRGLTGAVAALFGKRPPTLYYWIVAGEAPAFVKFEGPLYFGGPVWRVELTGPRWP
ncbi:MAG TPA: hypothetical protein VGX21_20220 [Methylomirabilota bacterium]|nr:hypothetical protein [Methylomirabilota bacterium]